MANQRVGSIDQPITTSNQAITQVPVFSCPMGSAGITLHCMEVYCWKSQIVGGEECRVLGGGIPTSIEMSESISSR